LNTIGANVEGISMNRRDFLAVSGLAALGVRARPASGKVLPDVPGITPAIAPRADVTLRIGPVSLELAPGQVVHTIGYNGKTPGPLLRMREGAETTIDVVNDLDYDEIVHWHGQLIPSVVDGSSEEGTPGVSAHGNRRYSFKVGPSGTRWYHSHSRAGSHLDRGLYSGQFGFFVIDPASEPGRYDREVFLALREWNAFFTNTEMEEPDENMTPAERKEFDEKKAAMARKNSNKPNGLEVGYRHFSINDRALGHGEPIRVKAGERVLFRVLNASATESRKLALPGHKFTVIALDGNKVPTPATVDVLAIGPAERVDAIVEMNQPGVWVMGVTHDDDRKNGMGIVVEYAGRAGKAVWRKPANTAWDYTVFGRAGAPQSASRDAAERVELSFGKINGGKGGFNRWTINGKSYPERGGSLMGPASGPDIDPIRVHAGKRYRLAFTNEADDAHPIHLHRHIFELKSVDGKATAGVMKDTVLLKGFGHAEVEFVANNPGPTLFHCHQQLHMDYGFMTLVEYV
jgi:FtsP/CotA-like multicopper oxidase with cupredoxin domain